MERGGPVVVFHCNWHGRLLLDEVGRRREPYPWQVVPVQVSCLARMHAGLVLKALQAGAARVLMLGCAEGECHFGCDGGKVSQVHAEAQRLAEMLGFGADQVILERPAADGDAALARVLARLGAETPGVDDSGEVTR